MRGWKICRPCPSSKAHACACGQAGSSTFGGLGVAIVDDVGSAVLIVRNDTNLAVGKPGLTEFADRALRSRWRFEDTHDRVSSSCSSHKYLSMQ